MNESGKCIGTPEAIHCVGDCLQSSQVAVQSDHPLTEVPKSQRSATGSAQKIGRPSTIRSASKQFAKRSLGSRLRKGKNVVVMRQYAELRRLAWAFAERHFKLVIIIGNPGLGKTRLFKTVLGDQGLLLHGRVTPLQLYIQAYRHRGLTIVIDDVAGVLSDKLGVSVLKDLCQTEAEKTVAWHSSTKVLREEGVPSSFKTTSPVCIITNDWPTFDAKLPALEDRAQLIVFDPSRLDIHGAASEWFRDQEVFDFIGENLYFLRTLSLRTYQQAAEFKAAGFEWQKLLVDQRKAQLLSLVARLKDDPSLDSEERVRRFAAEGGGSRATYFRYVQLVAGIPRVPRIILEPPKLTPVEGPG
jgi:hypothetical protein